jgi:hypothetical protein
MHVNCQRLFLMFDSTRYTKVFIELLKNKSKHYCFIRITIVGTGTAYPS